MNSKKTTSLVLASLFLLGACAAAGGTLQPAGQGGPDPNGTDLAGLNGRTFLSTAVKGRQLVAGSTIRIAFQNGQISVGAGCNSMSGAYSIDGDRLVAGSLATTDMGCEQPLMDQDTWVSQLLNGATLALAGDTLTLTQGDVVITLTDREVADPDRPLEGTRWVLDGIVQGGAVSSVPAGVTAAFTITSGQLSLEAGCNGGGGPVEVTDDSITFGTIALTKMACGPDAMGVEAAMTGVLAGTVGYTIEAGTLRIEGVGAGLMFRAAP